MLGPETLVGVPAALCERWAQWVRCKSGHLRWQPTRELVGRVTVVVAGNPAVFFNTAGTPVQVSKAGLKGALHGVGAVGTSTSVARICLRSIFFYSLSFSSLVAFVPLLAHCRPSLRAYLSLRHILGRLFVVANMGRFFDVDYMDHGPLRGRATALG